MAKPVTPKRRRLSDLYRVGNLHSFDDGFGEPVEIYIRRPNPYEMEMALKNGNAARARAVLAMNRAGTPEYELVNNELWDLGGPQDWAKYLVENRTTELYQRAFAFVSDLEEYKKDGILDSTLDNMAVWAEKTPDEGSDEWNDYVNAKEYLDEFYKLVDEKFESFKNDELAKVLHETDDLEDAVRRVIVERLSGAEFVREYRISCVFYATREPDDYTKHYFSDTQEVRELSFEVLSQLFKWYDELDLEKDAAKNSLSADSSSKESAPSESPETSELSGQETVSV